MGRPRSSLASGELERIYRAKQQAPPSIDALGPQLIAFFKHSVEKRQGKLSNIAACWTQLVPELISEHCALESFTRGTLTVIVDSAAHLYELKQLLLAGLEQQILLACRSTGLRKIALKRGRWYDAGVDVPAPKMRFDR